MYAQTHLACDEFDAIGLTVPGVPGFPHFGHNGKVAWCVTHAFVDIHDLYVERFDAGGHNTSFKGGLAAGRRTAPRPSRSAAAATSTIDVVETHARPGDRRRSGRGHRPGLRSMQFAVPDHSFDCLLPMLRRHASSELYDGGARLGR